MAKRKPKSTGSKPAKKAIESYTHEGQQRPNNPPVGLVTAATDPPEQPKKTYAYDPHLDPQLVWAGKAEGTSFDVPTVSLHVHERIDPKTIIQAVRSNGNGNGSKPVTGNGGGASKKLRQRSMFEEVGENPPLREAIDFYRHPHGWTNRLIAGDSLLVMNSLLEKEGLAGKVQMVFFDPPYGVRYGSNFQPFVKNRDVRDGKDSDLTQEPEMIRAFRDTWELGIHSYLTAFRDRAKLARELLSPSGSIFVQIGDANVHLVRAVLDEVYGPKDFCGLISYAKTTTTTGRLMPATNDYILWYARNSDAVKYRPLYQEKAVGGSGGSKYDQVELADGTRRPMTPRERNHPSSVPADAKVFCLDNLTSPRIREGRTGYYPIEVGGRQFLPQQGEWKTNPDGMHRLMAAARVAKTTNIPRYVRFLADFPAFALTNTWLDIGGIQSRADPKVYVVQTSTTAVQRCMLMTTDPGDLVLDPTCGSGTTAYVAEQWGRRWITCDTSRVAITLAKQRLMTANFDYYKLAHESDGVGGGFVYKTVPHVTLKSIANNPEIKEGMTRVEIDAAIQKYAEQETLYDQPQIDKTKARVTGPFTVEAVPAVTVRPLELVTESRPLRLDPQSNLPGVGELRPQAELPMAADISITRYGETARQRMWRDELLACGVRGKSGQRIEFARLEPLPGCRCLHAIGETKPRSGANGGQKNGGQKDSGTRERMGTGSEPDQRSPAKNDRREVPVPILSRGKTERVVVSFGPEYAPLEQRQVEQAWEEARELSDRPSIVLFAAFQFDPEAAKDIDALDPAKTKMLFLRSQMNTDLLTEDLKKKRASNESFWLIGQPDVELRQIKQGDHKGQWQVAIRGFDYYNPAKGTIESGDTSNVAMWLLDPDYDGRSLFPRQVFFPMAGPKDGWARLAKSLKAEIDEELIEAYRGIESLPFEPGKFRRAAVKIIDDRGIESLKILEIG